MRRIGATLASLVAFLVAWKLVTVIGDLPASSRTGTLIRFTFPLSTIIRPYLSFLPSDTFSSATTAPLPSEILGCGR